MPNEQNASDRPSDELIQRLVDLESKLLLLEHDFEALNAAFVKRGERLVDLDRQIDALRAQVADSGEQPRTLEEERPPHY